MPFDLKEWLKAYRKTEHYKELRRKYQQSEKGRAAQKRERETAASKARKQKYALSERAREKARERNKTDKYQKDRKTLSGTKTRKKKMSEYQKKYLDEHPDVYAARKLVTTALKNGTLQQEPCEVCGKKEKPEAHHDDYAKPLDVRWFCKKHHSEHHVKIRQLLRKRIKRVRD